MPRISRQESLTYPIDLDSNTFVQFSPMVPVASSDNQPSQTGSSTQIANKVRHHEKKATISLYHPEMGNSNSQVEWEAEDTGLIKRLMVDGKMIYNESTSISKSYDAIKKAIGDVAPDLFLGGVVRSMINKDNQAIQNPMKDMFFKGVGFREFSFSFTFAPKSEQESEKARNIVTTFKRYAHPDEVNATLTYPPMWSIYAQRNGVEIQQFHPSYLTAVNVDFVPNQVVANYTNGAPTNIKLDLTFKESKIVTAKDFTNLKRGSYGY